MLSTAIILAGGFGTRLQSVINNLPKPMAPVCNKPFLDFQVRYLKHFGFQHIIFSVGYKHEVVESYFKNNYLDINIDYALEKEPLGTGGGIRLAIEKSKDENVLVLNGDSFFDMDLKKFYQSHLKSNSNNSLALRKVSNAARYGTIQLDEQNQIISFLEKNNLAAPGLINAGVYILNKKQFLDLTPQHKAFSIEKNFFETKHQNLNLMGFEFEGYFIDIGIPEDYNQAKDDFKRFKY